MSAKPFLFVLRYGIFLFCLLYKIRYISTQLVIIHSMWVVVCVCFGRMRPIDCENKRPSTSTRLINAPWISIRFYQNISFYLEEITVGENDIFNWRFFYISNELMFFNYEFANLLSIVISKFATKMIFTGKNYRVIFF